MGRKVLPEKVPEVAMLEVAEGTLVVALALDTTILPVCVCDGRFAAVKVMDCPPDSPKVRLDKQAL